MDQREEEAALGADAGDDRVGAERNSPRAAASSPLSGALFALASDPGCVMNAGGCGSGGTLGKYSGPR
jgi:hypothetical protein